MDLQDKLVWKQSSGHSCVYLTIGLSLHSWWGYLLKLFRVCVHTHSTCTPPPPRWKGSFVNQVLDLFPKGHVSLVNGALGVPFIFLCYGRCIRVVACKHGKKAQPPFVFQRYFACSFILWPLLRSHSMYHKSPTRTCLHSRNFKWAIKCSCSTQI